MEKLVNYEIQVRRWGPDGEVMNMAYTAGITLVVVQHAVACYTPDVNGKVLLPPQIPLSEPVADLSPMLALCKTTRFFDDLATANLFKQKTNELWSLFDASINETPQDVLNGLYRYRNLTVPQFGPTIDMFALEEIDLSNSPPILESFRHSYRRIFQDQIAFDPAFMEAFVIGQGWDFALLGKLAEASADPNHPIHTLEMWWWHACSLTCIPPLEAFLGV